MPFELTHKLVSRELAPRKQAEGEFEFFTVSLEGSFEVLFPGRLIRGLSASFNHRFKPPVSPGEPVPVQGGSQTDKKLIVLKLRIFSPDGVEFTGTEITAADLRKHRDLRGRPSGRWSFKLNGESDKVFIDEISSIFDAKGTLDLAVIETVRNDSAPPLIDNKPIPSAGQSFSFDLFRVGTFSAQIKRSALGGAWRGTMTLFDHRGTKVASTTRPHLRFGVGLAELRPPRGAGQGLPLPSQIPKWRLEVLPQGSMALLKPRVSANVIAAGRIGIPAIQQRIDKLLGPRGSFIELFGENQGGKALGRLKIKDVVAAETVQMHDLLDDFVEDAPDGDIVAFKAHTIASRSEVLEKGIKLDVRTLKLGTIDVAIGPGLKLGAAVPSVRLSAVVSGAAKLKFKGLTLATARVRNGRLSLEVGIKLAADGTPRVVTSIPDSPFDIEIDNAAKVALLAVLGLAGLIGGLSVTEYLESEINGKMVAGARRLLADQTIAPRVLMMIFGAHLTHLPPRIEGDAFVFEHIAPLEPEARPTPGYQGAVGRTFTPVSSGGVSFNPPTLDDTWASTNLDKIDHVVMVMMENRSYDHVLGYRANDAINDGADGLTKELITAIEGAPGGPFDLRDLQEASFAANAVNRKTRLPKSVGHDVKDVAEQLQFRVPGPKGPINSPRGFVENFRPRLKSNPLGVVADDVIGFYGADDLPFFAYLAEHYAYCDRYFCSHPGPTLPNRMYSLVGDVQHDRHGFPILENNSRDNFLLSRQHTIGDFLLRKGLDFRIYESEPSVTMLRLFARYATDQQRIVPLARLAADVSPAGRGLPAFTMIEPALHHHPQNDDHPDADMHRGQIFLRDVYNTLRSNPAIWKKTLLIITYDEHGGLYDHVVPPVADVYSTFTGTGLPPIGVLRKSTGRGRHPAVEANLAGIPIGILPVPLPNTPLQPLARAPLPIPYGVRVPTFVVSPWTTRGKGPSTVLDHCSILKTVLARFMGTNKPFLSDRVHAAHSFNGFLTEAAPRMNVPPFTGSLDALPLEVRSAPSGTTQIVTPPLSRAAMRAGPVDWHDLTGRWARQLGR
jgi:phospholipase C